MLDFETDKKRLLHLLEQMTTAASHSLTKVCHTGFEGAAPPTWAIFVRCRQM